MSLPRKIAATAAAAPRMTIVPAYKNVFDLLVADGTMLVARSRHGTPGTIH